MYRFFVFICLYGCLATIGFTQLSSSPYQSVEKAICQFKMSEADALTEEHSAEYKYFYKANISLYKYLAKQNESLRSDFYNDWDNAVSYAETMSQSDSKRNLLLSELYAKRAVVEFLNQDYIRASLHTKDAHGYIQANAQIFPDEVGNKKLLGAFNLMLSNVPKKFQWFFSMLGFKGNSATGYEQLKAAVKEDVLLRHEVNILLYFVERNLLGKLETAKQRLIDERDRMGSGMLIDFMLASAYISLNDNENAYKLLSQRSKYADNGNVFFITYWDYMLGKSYMFKEEYTKANKSFGNFLTENAGVLFISDAIFRQGVSAMLSGDYATAQTYFQKVHNSENAFDEDEYAIATAKRFARSQPSYYTKLLYRTRNLFDGGYYTECILLLDKAKKEISSMSDENRVEMFYRYGRTYHKSDFLHAAKTAYEGCIENTHPGSMKYMQAYSCYYLGELYKKENKETAKHYYKKGQSYTDFPYESGLETKIRYALSRL